MASVTIQVVDGSGASVLCWLQNFTDTRSQRDLISHFHGLQGTDIPYGRYEYTLGLGPPGSTDRTASGTAMIQRPDELLVLQPIRWDSTTHAFDIGVRPGFMIEGRVRPVPPPGPFGQPLRIRLTPIDSGDHLDVSVGSSGQFYLYEPLIGRYLLVVIRGPEVLHVEAISFDPSAPPTPLVIKLPDKPPPIIHTRPLAR
jgi:hypothetical protein